MNELWFIPIIGVLSLVSSIISSTGTLYDKRFKWHNRLTMRGKIVALIGLCIVFLSIWQYIYVKKQDEVKEFIQIQQRRSSDSIITSSIKKGVDSSQKQLFNNLSEAFIKQNLKLDTVTKNIEKIKISEVTKEIPIIIIRKNSITHRIKNDTTIDFSIQFVSRQAASSIMYINYLCEFNFIDGSKTRTEINKLFNGKFLVPKDEYFSKGFEIDTNKKLEFVTIALVGKYTG